jgi:hypothetical protein
MDTTPLRDAYDAFLDAGALVTGPGAVSLSPPAGEWDAVQILAHVSLLSAATIAAASAVASGVLATYDNRTALDPWRIDRVIGLAGGSAGLADRIRGQRDALCAHGGPMLSESELDTLLPTLLLSNGEVLLDQPVPLRDIFTGLAGVELPGHTKQLLALLPDGARAGADFG